MPTRGRQPRPGALNAGRAGSSLPASPPLPFPSALTPWRRQQAREGQEGTPMSARKPAPSRVSASDLARLQAHLRRTLDTNRLHLVPPTARGGSVQARVGAEVLGTLDQVDDEGERCWVLTLVVLEEDLGVLPALGRT